MKIETFDEMTDAEVLAMALDDMERLGLIKWKPDADKKFAIDQSDEAHGQRHVSSGALADQDLRAVKLRSLDDQVRQLLEQAALSRTNLR